MKVPPKINKTQISSPLPNSGRAIQNGAGRPVPPNPAPPPRQVPTHSEFSINQFPGGVEPSSTHPQSEPRWITAPHYSPESQANLRGNWNHLNETHANAQAAFEAHPTVGNEIALREAHYHRETFNLSGYRGTNQAFGEQDRATNELKARQDVVTNRTQERQRVHGDKHSSAAERKDAQDNYDEARNRLRVFEGNRGKSQSLENEKNMRQVTGLKNVPMHNPEPPPGNHKISLPIEGRPIPKYDSGDQLVTEVPPNRRPPEPIKTPQPLQHMEHVDFNEHFTPSERAEMGRQLNLNRAPDGNFVPPEPPKTEGHWTTADFPKGAQASSKEDYGGELPRGSLKTKSDLKDEYRAAKNEVARLTGGESSQSTPTQKHNAKAALRNADDGIKKYAGRQKAYNQAIQSGELSRPESPFDYRPVPTEPHHLSDHQLRDMEEGHATPSANLHPLPTPLGPRSSNAEGSSNYLEQARRNAKGKGVMRENVQPNPNPSRPGAAPHQNAGAGSSRPQRSNVNAERDALLRERNEALQNFRVNQSPENRARFNAIQDRLNAIDEET